MGSAAFVTPRLFVGDQLNLAHISTRSADAAVRFIAEGQTVLVPTWEIAAAVLEAFGAPADHIAWLRSQIR